MNSCSHITRHIEVFSVRNFVLQQEELLINKLEK